MLTSERLIGREMQAPPHVRVLTELAELEAIRPQWQSWPGNRDSEIDSYLAFVRSTSATIRPHVVVVEREGRPDAIFVGRIDRSHIYCRFGYLNLNLPATILVFVYGAFRGQQSVENVDLITKSVLQSLEAKEADAAYMNFLRSDSELCRVAKSKPAVLCRDYLSVTQQHFAASLPAQVEDFHRGLSTKVRKNQKWQAKKLDENFGGDVRIRCFRDSAEIEELATVAERLTSKSYQRGLGVGFVDTPAAREHMRLKAERGWLRGYVLYLGGDPAAFWMGDINAGTFGSDYLAFDPAFAKHSPGMYLILKVIERLCSEGDERVSAIDFGPGHAQYKEVLSTEEWRETAVYMFSPSLKGMVFNLIRTMVGGTDQTLKAALTRAKLLQKIKKMWRARMAAQAAPQPQA